MRRPGRGPRRVGPQDPRLRPRVRARTPRTSPLRPGRRSRRGDRRQKGWRFGSPPLRTFPRRIDERVAFCATLLAGGMSGCLSEDAVVDLLEGRLPPDEVAEHLDVCTTCRTLVGEAARAMGREYAGSRASTSGGGAPPPLASGTQVERYVVIAPVG